jgi:outer membrane protein assembly factor BamB
VTPLLVAVLLLAAPSGGTTGFKKPDPSTLHKVYGVRHQFELFQFELLKSNHEEWTTPYLSGDGVRMFVGARSGRLECREVGNGDLLWKREDMGAIGASLGEFRGNLVIGSDSSLLLLDQQLGEERLRVDVGASIGGRMVITGTVALLPLRPNLVMAVDLVAGKELWRTKRPTPDGITVRGQAAPAVDRAANRVYLGFSDGSLAAVTLDKGTQVWLAPLGRSRDFFADVDTQPLLVDGGAALIAASYNGGLYKVDAATGHTIWKSEINKITGMAPATPGILVASDGDGQILGIYASNGKVRWRYKMKQGAPTEPVYLGRGMVAIGSSRGPLSILDAEEGQPIQLITPGSGMSAAPFARDPNLLVMTNKGLFLALRYGEGR